MKILIVIGAYQLVDFVRLNLHACREFLPGCDILISDDKSERSLEMEALADEFDCWYTSSLNRRTHVSGDWQAFINGSAMVQDKSDTWVLKLSQRLIPSNHVLVALEELHRLQPEMKAFLPGKLDPIQIARPGARFYNKFGHLTDIVLFDPKTFTPAVLKKAYDEGYGTGQKGDLFSELAWGRLMQEHPCQRVPWMTNYEPSVKPFLRKACCTSAEYATLADRYGIKGEWDVREWKQIEGPKYRSVPA